MLNLIRMLVSKNEIIVFPFPLLQTRAEGGLHADAAVRPSDVRHHLPAAPRRPRRAGVRVRQLHHHRFSGGPIDGARRQREAANNKVETNVPIEKHNIFIACKK